MMKYLVLALVLLGANANAITNTFALTRELYSVQTNLEQQLQQLNTNPDNANDFVYELADASYTITAYTGTVTDVVIPDTYNGLPVTRVLATVFQNFNNPNYVPITSASGGNNLKTIEAATFLACDALTSVELKSVTAIGDQCFSGCSALTSATLPLVEYVGIGSFSQCTALTSLSLPKLKLADVDAFVYCTGLTTIDFPMCQFLRDRAFEHCQGLTDISLPALTELGAATFNYSGITSFTAPILRNSGEMSFGYCTGLTSVIAPDLRVVGIQCFVGCTALAGVDFELVTDIGIGAFSGCTALSQAIVPSAKTIGYNAFDTCTSLTSIELQNAIDIGENAFKDCTALATVYFAKDMPTDYGNAYSGITALTNIVRNSTATWTSTFNGQPVLRLPMYSEKVHLTTNTVAAVDVGDMFWDTEFGVPAWKLSEAVTWQGPLESLERVKNNETFTLTDGQIVYFQTLNGSMDIPRVKLASSMNPATKNHVIGMVTEPIVAGAVGYVCTRGMVNGLNTSAYMSGDDLWLTTNGLVTATEPDIATVSNKVYVGNCLRSQSQNGRVFVSIRSVPTYADVGAPAKADLDSKVPYANVNSLTWNLSTGNMVNVSGATIGSTNAVLVVQQRNTYASPYTQYMQLWKNASSAVVAYLNADGTFQSNGGFVSGVNYRSGYNGTVGTINFCNSAGVSGMYTPSDASVNFATLSTNRMTITNSGNVGIGTNAPQAKIHVNGDAIIESGLAVKGPLTVNGNQVCTSCWQTVYAVASQAYNASVTPGFRAIAAAATNGSGTINGDLIAHQWSVVEATVGSSLANTAAISNYINWAAFGTGNDSPRVFACWTPALAINAYTNIAFVVPPYTSHVSIATGGTYVNLVISSVRTNASSNVDFFKFRFRPATTNEIATGVVSQ